MTVTDSKAPSPRKRVSRKEPGTPLGFSNALALGWLVFAAGWFVMLTELVGARVLSPYFGNTIYVWGSVIGIFLLAMAIGYAIGGRLTKRFSSPIIPATFVAIAGIYVAGTQVYQDKLCSWLCNMPHMDVKWGALLATSILYGLPMILLGGVSPYSVHIATKTHKEAGNRAGMLYALSTVGSFVGCMVTAFFLIPNLPLWQTTLSGGIILAAIALVVGLTLSNHKGLAGATLILLLGVVIVLFQQHPNGLWHPEKKAYEYGPIGRVFSQASSEEMKRVRDVDQLQARKEASEVPATERKILLETETPYHHLVIAQKGPLRQMIFGNADFHTAQTTVDLRDLPYHVAEYTSLSFATMLYKPAPKRVCFIGIGGAVIPRALERFVPDVKIDAVDVDPVVIKAAQKYFFWHSGKNVTIYAQDGRSFLNWALMTKQPKYDWVILDAYSDDYVPFHLTTEEYMSIVGRVLAPDGVVAANLLVDEDLYGCEARTLKKVFGNVTPFVGHRSGNIILVSQNGRKNPMSTAEAASAAKQIKLPPDARIDFRDIISSLSETQNWTDKGSILTDVWSPVENLIK